MVKFFVTTMGVAFLLNSGAFAAPFASRTHRPHQSSQIVQARDHWTGGEHYYSVPRGQQSHPGGGGSSK